VADNRNREASIRREVTNCYCCGSNSNRVILVENGFDLVKCSGCGTLFISNPPTDETISKSVVTGIYDGEKQLDVNVRYNRSALSFYKSVLPEIFPTPFRERTTWLDVGCGYGEFLEALQRQYGPNLVLKGSEPNEKKQKAAKARGHNVGYIDLATCEEQFDVVSLMNVYSHLPNPPAFLSDLSRTVIPGGLLLIQTGDSSNIDQDNIMKPAGLPDHMSFTNAAALTEMLARLNFKVERIVHRPSVPLTLLQLGKEVAKFILPNRDSFLRYYFLSNQKKSRSMLMLARKSS